MVCKNCIHYEVCMYVNAQAVECARAENCKLFRDTAGYRKQSVDRDTNVLTKWISVEDRLPAYGELVLVSAKDLATEEHKWFYLARYKDNNWYGEENYMFGRVTHWMPLPDAPKGGERDG